MTHDAWIAEIAAARRKFEDQNAEYYKIGLGYSDAVHPAVIAKELGDFLYRGKLPKEQTTIASGGYGIARYVRRELRGFRPGQIMNGAYQYGAIGPDVGYAVGVAAAVQLGAGAQAAHKGHPIICITGDAGFGYTAMEIDTMAKYKLPVVAIVYNNNAWGTWTGAAAGSAGAADSPVPGEPALRQAGRSARRARRVRHAAGGVPPGARARVSGRAPRRPARRSSTARGRRNSGIARSIPPGALGKIEPGVMSYYH